MSKSQLTIGGLIDTLKRKDPSVLVTFDFVHFSPRGVGSFRGYYEDLAIGYAKDECTVECLLALLNDAVGKTFSGYKGGEYTMCTDTVVWVANHGESADTAIVDAVDDGWRVVLKTEVVGY